MAHGSNALHNEKNGAKDADNAGIDGKSGRDGPALQGKGVPMTRENARQEGAARNAGSRAVSEGRDQTIVLEVNAAYNREGLTMPKPNGPNGRRVLNLEMLMNHSFYWEWLSEREAEEVLMELYVARTRRSQ